GVRRDSQHRRPWRSASGKRWGRAARRGGRGVPAARRRRPGRQDGPGGGRVNDVTARVRYSFDQVWSVVPALLGAGLIFIAGYFVARQLERWIDAWLSRMDFNRMAEAGGLREAVDRTGARLDPVHAVGKLVFWLVMLIVVMLVSAALGLESINEMFGIMIAFIPTLLAAIVVIVLGKG